MTITTIMIATPGTKYVSATESGVGVGAAVAVGACITVKAVSDHDGK